jgi:putative two-component system response regulator
MLGSVDYMAPEQARDARSVDIRADIYGLGGTLYWLLGGQKPFPGDRPMIEELLARQRESPMPLNKLRADIPLEMEAVVYQMMALEPADRYPTPMAVMSALSVFVDTATHSSGVRRRPATLAEGLGRLAKEFEASVHSEQSGSKQVQRVLVVSSSSKVRTVCRTSLEACGLECHEAGDQAEAGQQLQARAFDVVLLDEQLPDVGGLEFCSQLRAEPPGPHLKIVLMTPEPAAEWLSASQKAGADDCLPRTAHPQELATRIRATLRLKEAEERADCLAGHLLTSNQQLEQILRLRDADLYQAQDVLIYAMAKMAELRGLETGAHLLRMQGYVRVLAEEAMRLPAFAGQIDDMFVRLLERCVLLHDIGKVAIPDHILLKPGKFDAEERSVMESHTIVGADILAAVARQNGASLAFLQMATDIARHHHERFDGTGYPGGLAGEAIPLSARIVTIADVYDALRSKLVYKPGLAHQPAKRLILESNNGQFDPALLVAFRHCASNFEQIFAQTKD